MELLTETKASIGFIRSQVYHGHSASYNGRNLTWQQLEKLTQENINAVKVYKNGNNKHYEIQ